MNPIVSSLLSKGFELVDSHVGPTQIVLLGRCPLFKRKLEPVVNLLLRVVDAKEVGWTLDVSRVYRLSADKRTVQAIRFIFQHPEIKKVQGDIANVISSIDTAVSVEVGSAPLIGASPNRNAPNPGGKGAWSSGKFVPTAALMRQRGM